MMTVTIALDDYTREAFELLDPHYDIHSTAQPGELKHNIGIPAVTVAMKAEWMNSEEMIIG